MMHQVRASFTAETIRVYQAYGPAIANKAVAAQRFVSPFKMERMTWIKPSFFWMMYRAGWALKPDQERVLAVDISRAGFEWALAHGCLSHFSPAVHASPEDWLKMKEQSPVRVQFDPDRSPAMELMERRAIQIGLSGEAVERYVRDWTVKITDITPFVRELHALVLAGPAETYLHLLPTETIYPLTLDIGSRIGCCSVES